MALRTLCLAVAAVLGCSAAPAPKDGPGADARPAAKEGAPPPASSATPVAETPDGAPLRVLVTGFHDWKDLGDPPNVWRRRDNPSCRLLVGDATSDEPTSFSGPLPNLLQAGPDPMEVQWSFASLPVTWGAADRVTRTDYDVVIHLGLGVYDRFDVLQVERGAYNGRHGKDAAGNAADPKIGPDRDAPVLPSPDTSDLERVIAAVEGMEAGDYRVTVADARSSNSFLCNETHYSALDDLSTALKSGGDLSRVFFVHIPYAKDDDYAPLAEGVAQLVRRLATDRPS